ncbi:MAG TPA: ATP synthase F1 subunit delta, partial [Candidatus Omnitrophota bacterium]|nr:ATP synthase F1 subunit delta [Candidatus Omnitrophota bacterium]
MREDVLSKRYAEALIESSGDLDGIKKTVAEAKALRKALNDVPELAGFLKHPQIAASVKSEVMSRALSGHFSVVFHNFVKLLIDKARAEILQDTLDYVIRRYSYAGTQVVLLNTSVPLDEALISDIKGSVEKKI